MRKKLEFILAGTEVTRYHTVRTLVQETVGHHSHGVAMLCLFLAPDASANLLKAALVHDLAEHVLGDIPAPSKREFGIGEQVNRLEDMLLSQHNLDPEITKEEARILKLADIAQGALFCIRELSLGNSGIKIVFHRYVSYADSMILSGVERELFDLIKALYQEVA